MKKALAYAASAAMGLSMMASPAMAQDTKGPANEIAEFCGFFGNDSNGPGLPTKGSCTSFFRANDPAATCKELKDFDLLELFGFKSQGECVAFINSLN